MSGDRGLADRLGMRAPPVIPADFVCFTAVFVAPNLGVLSVWCSIRGEGDTVVRELVDAGRRKPCRNDGPTPNPSVLVDCDSGIRLFGLGRCTSWRYSL